MTLLCGGGNINSEGGDHPGRDTGGAFLENRPIGEFRGREGSSRKPGPNGKIRTGGGCSLGTVGEYDACISLCGGGS